ncbi:hypothetical protein GALL_552850 [mine drainage metagenome]|uniref:Uncharacterized protein n=1 Tax=mine drainage metagenome TaxID=410659 RepID=A0A1J5NY82_9ZZZZ
MWQHLLQPFSIFVRLWQQQRVCHTQLLKQLASPRTLRSQINKRLHGGLALTRGGTGG